MENKISISEYLKNRLPTISDKSIEDFKAIITSKTFRKGETLIDYGKKTPVCFLIRSGYVASFVKYQDGSDFIRTIYKKYSEIGSLQSLISDNQSNATYRALTDCDVYELNFNEFIQIQNAEYQELYIKILEKVYMDSEKRINELSALDATNRYLALKKDISDIDNLLPQYQIAKYLNITPVQLSRIRKKIARL